MLVHFYVSLLRSGVALPHTGALRRAVATRPRLTLLYCSLLLWEYPVQRVAALAAGGPGFGECLVALVCYQSFPGGFKGKIGELVTNLFIYLPFSAIKPEQKVVLLQLSLFACF